MSWKFSYEALLKVRSRDRNERLFAFSKAKTKVSAVEDRISKKRAKLISTQEAMVNRSSNSEQAVERLLMMGEFIRGERVLILREQEGLKSLVAEQDLAEKYFVEANIALKVLEKLKEKQWISYKKQRRKKENQKIDSINIMRGRK